MRAWSFSISARVAGSIVCACPVAAKSNTPEAMTRQNIGFPFQQNDGTELSFRQTVCSRVTRNRGSLNAIVGELLAQSAAAAEHVPTGCSRRRELWIQDL